jgi:predicted small secreted protein
LTDVRRLVIALAIGLIVVSAGCNTVQGVGRDMEAAGRAIQKTAK